MATLEIAEAVIVNLSQDITVLYSNTVIIFMLQTMCVVAAFLH